MSEFAHYLLDLLGEIGGGRGDPADDLARFALGLIFWLLLIGSVTTITRVNPGRNKSALLIGMSIGASREFLMLVTHSMALYGVVPASTLNSFIPPLDHALMMVSRITIAAAFLFYLLDNRSTARRYLHIGLGGAGVFYLLAASLWSSTLAADPQLRFTDSIGSWLANGWGLLTMGVAIVLLARSSGERRLIICIPFAFFFFDNVLSILNLVSSEAYSTSLTPISQAFHILALPWFGYIYWREQIDEQIRLSQKLIESERLEVVGQMAAGIAHDFNNHLQAILGHAQTPVETDADPQAISKRFEHISECVDKASTLVQRLLAFRTEDIGNEIETMDLNETVQSLAPMLKGLLSENQSISYRLDSRTANIRADLASIEQSIINLILNARDAMPNGGEIQLSTNLVLPEESDKHDKPTVRVSIADNGCGMDENTLRRAFEPFFTTKGVAKGTGLGLASINNDLHRLGGTVGIDSLPGTGTTVTLDFPGMNMANVKPRPLRKPRISQTMARHKGSVENRLARQRFHADVSSRFLVNKCILLAEGNPAIRNTAAAQLRSAGYTVIAVANGEAAMQSMQGASGSQVDLLMLDVAMPRIGGYEAYDAITKRHPDVPVVFLNGQAQAASKAASKAASQAAFQAARSKQTDHVHLIKPFHRDQLLKTIQSTLGKSPVQTKSKA